MYYLLIVLNVALLTTKWNEIIQIYLLELQASPKLLKIDFKFI